MELWEILVLADTRSHERSGPDTAELFELIVRLKMELEWVNKKLTRSPE